MSPNHLKTLSLLLVLTTISCSKDTGNLQKDASDFTKKGNSELAQYLPDRKSVV